MLRSSTLHSSNRLYRGEVRSLGDAIDTYLASLRYECSLFTDEDEFNRESKALFARLIEETEVAQREYRETVGAAERSLLAAWAVSGVESKKLIADAGLADDFSILAI